MAGVRTPAPFVTLCTSETITRFDKKTHLDTFIGHSYLLRLPRRMYQEVRTPVDDLALFAICSSLHALSNDLFCVVFIAV